MMRIVGEGGMRGLSTNLFSLFREEKEQLKSRVEVSKAPLKDLLRDVAILGVALAAGNEFVDVVRDQTASSFMREVLYGMALAGGGYFYSDIRTMLHGFRRIRMHDN